MYISERVPAGRTDGRKERDLMFEEIATCSDPVERWRREIRRSVWRLERTNAVDDGLAQWREKSVSKTCGEERRVKNEEGERIYCVVLAVAFVR